MRGARYGSIARSKGLLGPGGLSVCLALVASACTRPAPTVGLSGGGTASAGRGEGPRARLGPPPSLPGERLVARLCDLAGEAQLEQGERGLSQTLAALDTPYKLVSPYSGLRGEAALRVIEVAVAEPDVEHYPAPPPPPRAPEDKAADERPVGERAAPRFDPVWNRYRGVYESKLSLVSPPGSCYRFRLQLPSQATLSLAAAVIPPQQGGGVPLDLTVRLDDKELWRERIGGGSARLGRWLPLSLSLPPALTEAADGGGRSERRRELSLCSQPAAAGQPVGTAVFGAPEIWAEGQGATAPNLLLIIVDTLRADALAAMPKVSQYAARGARFSQAITAATWTRPALLALLGGDLPTTIGQNAEDMIPKERDRQRFYSLDRRLLPRVLRDAGLKVAAVGNNFFLLGYPQIGLSLGFDEVDDVRHPVLDSPAITRAAIQFLRKNQQRSFFLQLHYDAPHWPYSPPPEHLDKVSSDQAAQLQALLGEPEKAEPASATARRAADPQARAYLGEAAYADAQVAEVLAELSRLQLEQRTLVVILGDHGEIFDPKHSHFVQALKQPTMYHHGWAAYDEILRVPLLMMMPGRLPAGAVVNEQVRLIDVAPTVLEALGLWDLRATLPGGLLAEGQSLVPLLQGEHEPERPAFTEGQNVRALRRGGYLYLRRPDPRLRAAPPNVTATTSSGIGPVRLVTEELYDLTRDPYQHHDLLAGPRSPAIERTLADMRAEFTQRAPRPPEAKLPITHLALAPGGARSLSGVLLSEDPQLSLLGVRNGEVTPQQPGRLEVVLRSGGQLDVQVDPAAKLTLVLTLDGLPLAREQLLIGPFGLPLLASANGAGAAGLPDLTAVVAPREPEGDERPQIVLGGAMLARLTAAYPPVLGERGEVLVWRDQTSPGAAVTALSRPGAATQGEVATMMRDWGYAQPATSDAGSKTTAPPNPAAAAPTPAAPRPLSITPPTPSAGAPPTPPLLK